MNKGICSALFFTVLFFQCFVPSLFRFLILLCFIIVFFMFSFGHLISSCSFFPRSFLSLNHFLLEMTKRICSVLFYHNSVYLLFYYLIVLFFIVIFFFVFSFGIFIFSYSVFPRSFLSLNHILLEMTKRICSASSSLPRKL